MANRAELELVWIKVRAHLEAAVGHLPEPPRSRDRAGSLEGYREFLAHNELGLAFDELELLGTANDVPDAYWRELAAAALLMKLDSRAELCRSRIEESS